MTVMRTTPGCISLSGAEAGCTGDTQVIQTSLASIEHHSCWMASFYNLEKRREVFLGKHRCTAPPFL